MYRAQNPWRVEVSVLFEFMFKCGFLLLIEHLIARAVPTAVWPEKCALGTG